MKNIHVINQLIYITNSEEIKEGEYQLYNPLGNFDNAKVSKAERLLQNDGRRKKIILTTDQDLIKDGVQAIDDDFLQWFVKNPSCDEVEVKTRYVHYYKTGETFISLSKTPEFSSRNMQCIKIEPRYEIIIPIVEPKQETLEEVNWKAVYEDSLSMQKCSNAGYESKIAELQEQIERMYSEEEVLNIQEKYDEYIQKNFDPEFSTLPFKVFFEQFKKK